LRIARNPLWLHNLSLSFDYEAKRWSKRDGDKINLLTDAWVERFKTYADPLARTCREIMKSALQTRGLNESSPIYEDHLSKDTLYSRLTEGASIYLHPRGDTTGYAVRLALAYTLEISPEQRQEIDDLGHTTSSKGTLDGTPVMLQLHVTEEDDERHWANTSSVRPEFEMARRIMLTLTWNSTKTGEEVVYYLIRGKKRTSELKRAREAMSILEYANGTLELGTDSGPKRCDFGSREKNRAKKLDEDGVPCPGPGCTVILRSKGPKNLHFKSEPDCKKAFNALPTIERQNFQFFMCWACGKLFEGTRNVETHIKPGKRSADFPVCRAYYKEHFGKDAVLDKSNCGRFL